MRRSVKKEADSRLPATTAYTQNCIPVSEIVNGMIRTEDGRFLKVLEVEPINFDLRTPEEQDNIIHSFASFLKICPNKIQIKVMSKRADTQRFLDCIDKNSANEKVPACREMAEHYKTLIQYVGSQNAVTRRFFVIFEYEPMSEVYRTSDPSEIAVEMERTAVKLAGYLKSCGNKVVEHENEDFFLCEMLYAYYNRRTALDEPFYMRAQRLEQDANRLFELTEGERPDHRKTPNIPFSCFIAPKGIDFSHSKYTIIDGMYQSHLYLTSKGYPMQTYAGWMSSIITIGEGVDVDLFLTRQDRVRMVEKISTKIRLNQLKLKNREESHTDFEEINDSISSGMYLKRGISQGGEDVFMINAFLTVNGETREEMELKKQWVTEWIRSMDLGISDCWCEEYAAFQTCAPFLQVDRILNRLSHRNLLTSGASSCFPFTAYELADESGIMLGVNRRNNSLTVLDPFNTSQLKNANISIFGAPGSGKTFTESLMALRLRMMGVQCFIITPDKAHEYRRSSDAVGGSYIRISPASSHTVNIMDIRPYASPIKELIDDYDENEISFLAEKAQSVMTFLRLLITDMTFQEEALLEEAIVETYARFGITEDNASIFADAATKELKEMPVLGDLRDTLLTKREAPARLEQILRRFVTGAAQSFNRRTNVDLSNQYIVFDLEGLKDNPILPAAMYIALDFIWGKARENATTKKAIFIDEGWRLVGSSADGHAAAFVEQIFRLIRGYGGSAILSTQDTGDGLTGKNKECAASIITCSATKIVMNMEPKAAKAAAKLLDLSDLEAKDITRSERGQALVCAGFNHVPVNVIASKFEKDLITTDRGELEEQAKNRIVAAAQKEKQKRDAHV